MSKFFTGISLLIFIILTVSCNRSSVSLQKTNALGEIKQLQNLVFQFDKPLVVDSLLNRWDSTEYILFEPAIKGNFRWKNPDELVFSPSTPLPPATTFKAKLKDDLLQYSSYDKVENKKDIVFFTPALEYEGANATWIADEGNVSKPYPRIDLFFNYPIDPEILKEKLKLNMNGSPAEYSILTLSPDSRISLKLSEITPQDKDIEARITIEKGLIPEGGLNGTKENMDNTVRIPSPYNLLINDLESHHEGVSGSITVRTSQQVLMQDLSSYIRFDPAVKFTLQQTSDGFMISSENFHAEKSYRLTIKKGLRGLIGGVLQDQYDNDITFGELEPSVSFTNSKAVYLSSKGNENIELCIVNVPKLKVIISKIYESNLLTAHQYGYYPADKSNNPDDYYMEDPYSGYIGYSMGDVIYEAEIDTRTLPKSGNSRLFRFNVDDRLSDHHGIYHIKVRSVDNYWVTDNRLISKSDIGIIAREGRDRMVVFANSIKTAGSLKDVNIIVYGSNNQVLGMGSTNADGVAEIGFTRKEFAGFRPAMIIAKSESDFNYLPFNTTAVNTSRFETGGKRSNPSGLDAFIYQERDIYRPGESINFSVIVRDGQWKTPGELPLKMRFLLPNGKELKSFRKNLNAEGSLEASVDISPSAITGSYLLEVSASNDVLLATRAFHVEEFIPDRIQVLATLNKTTLKPGTESKLSIQARNFFGPPAANRKYETEIQVRAKSFTSKKFSNYNFGLLNQGLSFEKILREGITDNEGKAIETYSVPTNFKGIGILQATFFATVFDETGRPVSRSTSGDIITQDVFLGIGDDGYSYFPLNQPVQFPLIALTKDGQIASGNAVVKIIKQEYRTVLTRNGGYFRYDSQKDDKIIAEQNISVTGENSSYRFVPKSPGNYEIRVSIPGSNSYIKRSFYSYGTWGNSNSTFEVNTEGHIDIETDKNSYYSNETARLLFKTPFSGKMLVTIETDKVLSYQYINVEKRTASLDIKLNSGHLPNIYITASLIKPHEQSDLPLTAAHGFQRVKVEEKSRMMPVEILSLNTARSKTTQTIRVKSEPGAMVTLAAVDNGVLQISDYKTPDPYEYFYASRALEVNGYSLYPLLFPELNARLSSTGGDGEMEMSKRVNPMPAKRVKLVSYWSGMRRTNTKGEAVFEVNVPAFSGELRLMAVVYKNSSFGSKESIVTIADPIVLSTSLPRFLSPGDTINVPLTISNTTSKTTSSVASLNVKGPVTVIGESSFNEQLPANSEKRVEFRVVANQSSGVSTISASVKTPTETFSEITDISIRPAAPLQVLTGSGVITKAGSNKISIPVSDFIPGSVDYHLVVGRSPALNLGKQLKYLVQYPYGCTEQIISAAFPQLYFADLSSIIRTSGSKAQNANMNILEAIRMIRMRQLYNGAVMLWDGEGTAHWWTSVYAAHFLIESKKAGFEVEDRLLNGLLGYINNRLKNKETIQYYYNRDQQKKIAPKEVTYGLYVLALASQPNVPVMNYYKANEELLSLDGRYLLSASYAIAGDKQRFKELLPDSFSGENSVPQTGGSFYSDIRDEAIALTVLLDVDPSNGQIPVMAKHVSEKLKQRTWFSTQESAFSLIALGKMARSAKDSDITGDIRVNNKSVAQAGLNAVKLTDDQLKSVNIELISKGSGSLYYYWQSEGISSSGTYKEEDNFLKVRRRFFDRNGNSKSGNSFKQNELIIVQVSLEKSYSGPLENIVITDMLPAGFEIENPRTKEIPGMDWIKDASTPVSIDVRDDRIHLFADMKSNRHIYYYAVRAVTPGTFRMGPVSADAMYNGEYHSYHGGGTVVVN